MSATVAAALKKLAVCVLTDKRAFKTIGGIVLGILVIIIMPVGAFLGILSGSIDVDTDRLVQMVEENMSGEERERLENVEDMMIAIEEEMMKGELKK